MPQTVPAPTFVDLLNAAVTEPGLLHEAFRRFHNYSLGNQMLAFMQCRQRGLEPGPLATYATWQALGRQVRRGEKALVLCQPVTIRKTVERETAEVEEIAFTRFIHRARWFVVAQTDGKAIEWPEPPAWDRERALQNLQITETPYDMIDGNAQGFARGRSVAVSPIAEFPLGTLVHEMAHVVLGHTTQDIVTVFGRMPRDLAEVEAEGTAILVLATLNQPGLEYRRGYLQHWLSGRQIPERSAQRIFKAADAILRAGRAELSSADVSSGEASSAPECHQAA